jgi:hypothetical protein
VTAEQVVVDCQVAVAPGDRQLGPALRAGAGEPAVGLRSQAERALVPGAANPQHLRLHQQVDQHGGLVLA